MAKVAVYDIEGKEVGDIELNADVFEAPVNQTVLHTMVVNYLANQRQGTQSTKTRAEVRGGGRKPWRQKGTGRARQGSTRAPQWTKGGVAFAPKPRDYRYKLNKKLKRVGMKSALSSKVQENEILVLDAIAFEQIKTSQVSKMLNNLNVTSKALIVLAEKDDNVYLSARNIPGVHTTFVGTLNVYDILNHEKFIVTKQAVSKIEEVYADERLS